MYSVYSMDMLDKRMVHVPGGMEQDSVRGHHDSQNLEHELFVAGIFRLLFLNDSWPKVTKTAETVREAYCLSCLFS